MRKLSYWSFLAVFSLGCNSNLEKEVLVEKYFDAAFAKDYFELESILSEDLLFVGPKISDSLNKEELIDSWSSFHNTFDQAKRVNDESFLVQTDNGPEVFYYYESNFHHREKDVWLRFPLHVRVRFKENQISFIQIYVNQVDIQKQLVDDQG